MLSYFFGRVTQTFNRNLPSSPQLYLGLILLSMTILQSCGGSSTKSASTETNFDKLHANVFKHCKGCHGTGASDTAGGPDLRTQDKVHSNLVGKTVEGDYPDWETFAVNRADCMSIPLIDPKNSANSLVVAIFDDKVAADLSPCTVKSHVDDPQGIKISAANLSLLKTWIDDGAEK